MEIREKNRKQYKRPQISQVKLEIEEAVLVVCKTTNGSTGRGEPVGCKLGKCKDSYGS